MRPLLVWSNITSTTSSGRSSIHSSSRSFAQRLRLPHAAPARLVPGEAPRQLALLGGAEARRVAHLVEPVVVVQAEDERADRALLLARPPAHDHGVDRPHALDLHHADALARAVARLLALGDHALG